jgi:hypothetical protein
VQEVARAGCCLTKTTEDLVTLRRERARLRSLLTSLYPYVKGAPPRIAHALEVAVMGQRYIDIMLAAEAASQAGAEPGRRSLSTKCSQT